MRIYANDRVTRLFSDAHMLTRSASAAVGLDCYSSTSSRSPSVSAFSQPRRPEDIDAPVQHKGQAAIRLSALRTPTDLPFLPRSSGPRSIMVMVTCGVTGNGGNAESGDEAQAYRRDPTGLTGSCCSAQITLSFSVALCDSCQLQVFYCDATTHI